MTEIIKETVTTQDSATTPVAGVEPIVVVPTRVEATNFQTAEYMIYYAFGALEILLAFRLVLKLMGASISSGFVNFIYGVSGLFVLPFEGIFRRMFSQGIETTSVLEPATIVAMIVYVLIAWGVVKLVRVFSGERQSTS